MSKSQFCYKHLKSAGYLLAFLFICFVGVELKAVSAYPGTVEITQVNGAKINGHIIGDEYYTYFKTSDGYAAQKLNDGKVVYLKLVDGKFEPTNLLVGIDDPSVESILPNKKESVESIKAKIAKSPIPENPANIALANGESLDTFTLNKLPAKGTYSVLVLLVKFKGETPNFDKQDFYDLYVREGYDLNGAHGSVNDYFKEASFGKLNLTAGTAVPEWVSLPNDREYYAENPQEMLIDGLKALPENFNLRQFDNNGDGKADIDVDIIHTGYGQEYTADPKDVWSHKSALSWQDIDPVVKQGVAFDGYHTEPEFASDKKSISIIGTICHETHHSFGLPDLYDTSGNSAGIGKWGIMAAGSWGGPRDAEGTVPTHSCAWTKSFLEWLTPSKIKSNRTGVKLYGLTTTSGSRAYKISGGMAKKEYLLLENRQQVGFDEYIPGSGMVIYHIDDNNDSTLDDGPDFNSDNVGPHYRVQVIQADARWDLENNVNRGDNGDPFPGSSGTTSLRPQPDDASIPNTNSLYNAAGETVNYTQASVPPPYPTEIEIFNIEKKAAVVKFDVKVSSAEILTIDPGSDPIVKINSITIDEGNIEIFDIVLTKEPEEDVVLDITSKNDSIASVVAPTLSTDPTTPELNGKHLIIFTKDDWDVPQSVGIQATDDIYAGNKTTEIYVTPIKDFTDDSYKSLPRKVVTVNVVSDEVAEIIVVPHKSIPNPAIVIDEKDDGSGSNTGIFSVTLMGMPEKPVTIGVESLNPEAVTMDRQRLTFTAADYNIQQKITVTAIDNNFAGTDYSDIRFFVIKESSDIGYKDAVEKLERVECTDDETTSGGQSISFTIDPIAFTIDEKGPGNKGSFTVVLDGRPRNDVTLNLINEEEDALRLSTTQLIFTTDNWNDPQTVNVVALNDVLVGDRDVKITVNVDSSSDKHFLTDPPLSGYTIVTIHEMDDLPGFTVTPMVLSMKEDNDEKQVSVVLTAGPAEGVVALDLTPMTTTEVTVSPSQLIFDRTNWNIPQKVIIRTIPDNHLENDVETVVVSPNAAATYPGWMINPPENKLIKINIANDDEAGFALSEDHISFTEGSSGVYTVKLTAQPAPGLQVVINAMTNGLDDICMGTVASDITKTQLIFDEFNWNIPQPVTLFGIVDEYATDDMAFVTHTIGTESDPNFTGLSSQRIDVKVMNDDAINSATIITNLDTMTVNEVDPGRTNSFTVALDAIPRFGNVTVVVETLDPEEVFVHPELNPASGANTVPVELTFNAVDWNVPKTVYVSGYNNNFLGDGKGRIMLSIKSGSDETFVEKNDKKYVDVTIIDNDPDDKGGLSVSTNAVVVEQNNGKAYFNIVLTARPREDVTVTLAIPPVVDPDNDPIIARIVPETVVFTSQNWNIQKKITVYGDPGKKNIAITQTSVTLTPTGDTLWMNMRDPDPAPVIITVTGDTSKEYDLNPSELTVYEVDIDQNPGGKGNSKVDVVMNQCPAGTVTFTISTSNPTAATVSPTTLTFTKDNFFNPQSVTVTNELGDIDDDVELETIFKVTSAPSDPALIGLPPRIVKTTIMNINPIGLPDEISTITNKDGMGAPTEPIYIRVLENDTDPRGMPLIVKSVTLPTAGTAETSFDDPEINPQVVKYTPPNSSSPVGTPFTFTYIATNNEVANADSKPTKVSINVTQGQQVAYGSIVQLTPAEAGLKPKLIATYTDPIKDPTGGKPKTYTLRSSKSGPTGGINFEYRKALAIYDKKGLNVAYKAGISFDDAQIQKTSLKFQMNNGTADLDWNLLLRPPVIQVAKRYTAPGYDLNDTAPGHVTKLHAGSVIHLIGRFFGTKKPKAWLEYTDAKNRIKRAKCKVLKYLPFPNGAGEPNKSFMDVNPNSQTYGDSELMISITTHLPKDWDFTQPYKIVIDNGVGLASYAGLIVTEATANNNTAPKATNDNFDGAGEGPKVFAGSKKNYLNVLKNDILPNCDDVNVTFDAPPSSGGKVKWDKQRGVIVYTPPKGFGAPNEQIESFTYTITEKYTDQQMSSTATVRVTVTPF
jgi:M6 family metalloprotease-like protein